MRIRILPRKVPQRLTVSPRTKIIPHDWLEAHGLSLADIKHLEDIAKMQRKDSEKRRSK